MSIDRQKRAILAVAVSLSIAPPILADLIVGSGTAISNDISIVTDGGTVAADGSIGGSGTVVLTDGSASGTISNLTVDGKSSAAGNLAVAGTLITAGDFDLNGKSVDLGTTGTLAEISGRVFGDSGTISATRPVAKGENANIAGLGLSLNPESDMGVTTIVRGHSADTIGTRVTTKRWFDVAPGADVRAKLVFNWNTQELVSKEDGQRLYSSADKGSSWNGKGGTLDTAGNSLAVESTVAGRWTTAFNTVPVMTDISAPVIASGKSGTIGMDRVTAVDGDSDPLSLVISAGINYTVNGSTIIPTPGFAGKLAVNAVVFDGLDYSNPLTFTVDVRDEATNRVPVITSSKLTPIEKNKSGAIDLSMLTWNDPDGDKVSLIVGKGSNYDLSSFTITPKKDFVGTLSVPLKVTDGIDTSNVFDADLSVFEKLIEFNKGLVTMKGLYKVAVSPNPAPVGTRAVAVSGTVEADRVEIKIFDNVGNLLESATVPVEKGTYQYDWDISRSILGGTYVAFITSFSGNSMVKQDRVMIGVQQ